MNRIIRNGDELLMIDINGFCERVEVLNHNIMDMIQPVKCNHCGSVYDLTAVKVNHRYGDCDQFTTPCCNYRHADTRTWKSFRDFENLDYIKKLKIH